MTTFTGGPVPLVGVASSALASQFQSSPTASPLVNFALSQGTGTDIFKIAGLNMFGGQNLLNSQITSQLPATLNQDVNNQVFTTVKNSSSSLQFLGTTVYSQTSRSASRDPVRGRTDSFVAPATGYNRLFPGGGDEPSADYGGNSFTLSDVTFSILPANSGPQQFGLSQSVNNPTMMTTMAFGQSQGGTVPNIEGLDYDVSNTLKVTEMLPTAQFTTLKFNPESYSDDLLKSPLSPGYFVDSTGGWTFTTAPGSVSWSSNAKGSRVDVFGTNRPPVVSGTRGMRDLSLGDALIEGFSRNKTVEYKIQQLESLMNYSLNTQAGFVNVPVYQVKASDKSYGAGEGGSDGGYFIMTSVEVRETMRDLRGNSTRAKVDVSFVQVPAYQVDSGRDQASSKTPGGLQQPVADAVNQGATGPGASLTRQGILATAERTVGGK
jgi:hypothetical protein